MILNKLILLRHGESKWNLENRFTGWTDVSLTNTGKIEAKKAGALLKKSNYKIDCVYTSVLKRAINTSKICIDQLDFEKIDKIHDWRLNERHYGSLQGLNKKETEKKYGKEQVLIWRRSYHVPPPPLIENDERHPKYDKIYSEIDPKILPISESLEDTLNRVLPLWENNIIPQIKIGKKLMIVAHGNSLRAIIKKLMRVSNRDIVKLNIPTGKPYIFELNHNQEVINDFYL